MGGGKKKSEEEEIFFQGIMLLLYTGKSIKYDQEQSLFGTFEKSVNFDGKKKKKNWNFFSGCVDFQKCNFWLIIVICHEEGEIFILLFYVLRILGILKWMPLVHCLQSLPPRLELKHFLSFFERFKWEHKFWVTLNGCNDLLILNDCEWPGFVIVGVHSLCFFV